VVLRRELPVAAVAEMVAKKVVIRVAVTGERISSEVGFHRVLVLAHAH